MLSMREFCYFLLQVATGSLSRTPEAVGPLSARQISEDLEHSLRGVLMDNVSPGDISALMIQGIFFCQAGQHASSFCVARGFVLVYLSLAFIDHSAVDVVNIQTPDFL